MSYKTYKAGYENLWRQCKILDSTRDMVTRAAQSLVAPDKRAHTRAAAAAASVPEALIIALNYRESGGHFTSYLGNGDPLSRPTTHVPKGRGPFATWEEGAADALKQLQRPPDGDWTPAFCCYAAEAWNGFGYMGKGENSPYVWAATNLEQRGEYTGDHDYNTTAWDGRAGVAALLVALPLAAPDLALAPSTTQQEPPMADTQPAPTVDPLATVQKVLDMAKADIGLLTPFLPPPWNVITSAVVSLADDLIDNIEQAKTSGASQDVFGAIIKSVATNLDTIGSALKTPPK
jgi:lysozyme family protein